MDCSQPDFSVHGVFPARIPEWVAISSSRGSSWPRDWTPVCLLHLLHWQVESLPLRHWEAQISHTFSQPHDLESFLSTSLPSFKVASPVISPDLSQAVLHAFLYLPWCSLLISHFSTHHYVAMNCVLSVSPLHWVQGKKLSFTILNDWFVSQIRGV